MNIKLLVPKLLIMTISLRLIISKLPSTIVKLIIESLLKLLAVCFVNTKENFKLKIGRLLIVDNEIHTNTEFSIVLPKLDVIVYLLRFISS